MKPAIAGGSLGRLCRALLLPLLLLVVQQGAFLHELSHYKPAQVQDDEHEHEAGGLCRLCLAFAGVDYTAGFSTGMATLLPRLSFALPAVTPVIARAATSPAQRNRGPPVFG